MAATSHRGSTAADRPVPVAQASRPIQPVFRKIAVARASGEHGQSCPCHVSLQRQECRCSLNCQHWAGRPCEIPRKGNLLLHGPRRFFYAAFFLFCLSAAAQEPAVVAVGKGSYASSPPPQADEKRQGDKAADMDKWPLQIEPAASGLPVPTNQWWTSAVVRPFSGTIWPYPLAIRPEPSGVRVFFPIAWNEGGNDMPLDRPLAIRAVSAGPAAGGRPDILLADFEGATYPMGWEVKGGAFGSGPSRGPVDGQGPFAVYSGKSLAN